jgi:hypothetical protein
MSLSGTLARKGSAVVFSKTAAGAYNPLTGVSAGPTTLTAPGSAMQIDGDPDLYLALGLIESDSPTLLFRPATPGALPDLGWTVVWGGKPMTVKNINPLAMNGTPTAARIVVAR